MDTYNFKVFICDYLARVFLNADQIGFGDPDYNMVLKYFNKFISLRLDRDEEGVFSDEESWDYDNLDPIFEKAWQDSNKLFWNDSIFFVKGLYLALKGEEAKASKIIRKLFKCCKDRLRVDLLFVFYILFWLTDQDKKLHLLNEFLPKFIDEKDKLLKSGGDDRKIEDMRNLVGCTLTYKIKLLKTSGTEGDSEEIKEAQNYLEKLKLEGFNPEKLPSGSCRPFVTKEQLRQILVREM